MDSNNNITTKIVDTYVSFLMSCVKGVGDGWGY